MTFQNFIRCSEYNICDVFWTEYHFATSSNKWRAIFCRGNLSWLISLINEQKLYLSPSFSSFFKTIGTSSWISNTFFSCFLGVNSLRLFFLLSVFKRGAFQFYSWWPNCLNIQGSWWTSPWSFLFWFVQPQLVCLTFFGFSTKKKTK